MKPSRLTVTFGFVDCPKCRLPVSLPLFESGLGGDFETYVGQRTGSLYRLDLGQIHHQGRERAVLLAEAQTREGGATNLVRTPDEISCKVCGSVVGAASFRIEREDVVDVYEL